MDIVEAKKNLEKFEANRTRLLSYDHSYSTYVFQVECAKAITRINFQISNIKKQLDNEKR